MHLVEQGQLTEALHLFQSITGYDESSAEAWMMQGAIYRELCKPAQALVCLQRAVSIDPHDCDALYYLASVLVMQQAPQQALPHVQRAVELDPGYGEAWLLLGGIHSTLGRHHDAEQAFRTADTLIAGRIEPQIGIADALQAQGRTQEAAGIFDRIKTLCHSTLQAQPGNVEAMLSLADICSKTGAIQEAIELFKKALKVSPGNLPACLQLATLQHDAGHGEDMLHTSEAAVRLAPDSIAARMKVAEALELLGRTEEALTEARRALSLDENNIHALALCAGLLEKAGHIQEGLGLIAPIATRTEQPDVHVLLHYSALAKHGEQIHQAIELLEHCLQRHRPSKPTHHIALLFELGSLYDRVGNYASAFDTYRKANDARHRILDMHFDADTHSAYVDAIISNCSRPLLSRHAHCGDPSTVPVFIVGVPRSGTTLVEQILSHHPQVHGAGELTDIKKIVDALPGISATTKPYPQCLDSVTDQGLASAGSKYIAGLTDLNRSARRITDKMPANFMYLGLIQMLLPRARVIHCRRDPLDTCLSYYFHDFSNPHSYSYRLEDLAVYYENYRRLMAHWRTVLDIQLLEIQYEDLVFDQESTSRELVEFCGLDWDAACLSFHENRRLVTTTSYDQVRKPMYTSSVGRWKNYQAQLQPLISALGTGG